MSLESELLNRSNNKCELCESISELTVYEIPPSSDDKEKALVLCANCKSQIEGQNFDANHFRCLSGAMWSEHIPVQILSYRILTKLKDQAWAEDLVNQMYLDDEALTFATIGDDSDSEFALDSNGTKLVDGDAVTLIKDLEVKGANFTAKRGTLVKNISINGIEGQIEGRVNGTQIVLLTKFLKKVN